MVWRFQNTYARLLFATHHFLGCSEMSKQNIRLIRPMGRRSLKNEVMGLSSLWLSYLQRNNEIFLEYWSCFARRLYLQFTSKKVCTMRSAHGSNNGCRRKKTASNHDEALAHDGFWRNSIDTSWKQPQYRRLPPTVVPFSSLTEKMCMLLLLFIIISHVLRNRTFFAETDSENCIRQAMKEW